MLEENEWGDTRDGMWGVYCFKIIGITRAAPCTCNPSIWKAGSRWLSSGGDGRRKTEQEKRKHAFVLTGPSFYKRKKGVWGASAVQPLLNTSQWARAKLRSRSSKMEYHTIHKRVCGWLWVKMQTGREVVWKFLCCFSVKQEARLLEQKKKKGKE